MWFRTAIAKWWVLGLFTIALLTASPPAHGYGLKELLQNRLDPNVDYKTLRSANFDVHFPEHLEDVARVVAATAERVHRRVANAWDYQPTGRTHIVVVHRSDQTHIFTFVSPHRQVFYDIALPHQGIGLNDFADWHEWLLTHEYAHVAHLEQRPGVYGALGWVFGSWIRPNMTTPPWLKEGLAVWAEGYFTNYGSGQSPYYRMMMRAAVEEGVLRDSSFAATDTISNFDSKTWPWTFRPYLFGFYLARTLDRLRPETEDDPGGIKAVVHTTAARFPYDLDGGLKDAVGLDFEQLWQEALRQIEQEALTELQTIKQRAPLTALEYLTDTGFIHYGTEVSPDGKTLIVSRETPQYDNAILKIDLAGDDASSPEVLIKRTSGYQASFSASSRFVVFDQVSRSQRHYLVSDLYIYDRKKKEIVSISPYFRARDPDVHPDGKHVVFVANEQGKNRLYMTNTAWQQGQDLLGDVGYRRLSGPRFAPSGTHVALSAHDDKTAGEDIWLVSNDGVTVLIANGARNRNPAFSADGRWLVFSSDRTGIFNIYAYDLVEERLFQISHVTGGLFYPSLDPDLRYVYAVSYRAHGYDVARFKWDPSTWMEVTAVAPPRPIAPVRDFKTAPMTEAPTQPYEATDSLWPQTLTPSFLFRPDTYQIGGAVAATDPLFTQHYELKLRYDRASQLPVGSLFYFNGAHRYAFDLSVTQDAFPVENDVRLRLLQGQMAVNVPLDTHGTHIYLRPALWVQWIDFRGTSVFPGVSLSLQYDTEFQQLGQSFPEEGSFYEVGVRQTFPLDGSIYTTSVVAEARTHIQLGWLRHALHLELAGGTFIVGRDDPNTVFYAGGQESFPFSLSSPYLFYGYRTNALLGPSVVVATVHYTMPIVDIQRGLTVPPIALGRLSAGFRGQAAWVEDLTPTVDFETGPPWSVGVELYQEFVVGHLFGLRAQLGVYRGSSRWDGLTQVIFSLAASE